MLLELILVFATVAYGSNGWALLSPRHPSKQISMISPLQLTSSSALFARGGDAAEGEEKDDVGDSTSGDGDGDEDMRELRKKFWSSIPATPAISYPGRDRDQSTLGGIDDNHFQEDDQQPTKAIIIMDGFSPYHGEYLSHAARYVHGAAVIHILSDFMTRYLYQVEKQTQHLSSRLPDLDDGKAVEEWIAALPKTLEICGIYCESDSGLEDAERLGVALGLYPRCHDGITAARRDKFLMNQVVSEVGGLDVVKQQSCTSLEEAEAFAKGLGLSEDSESSSSVLVVAKPLRGVASDDVHLCSNLQSLRKAFTKIMHSPIFGSATAAKHKEVLLQEFATGTEYAVDVVCRDGERKAAAVFKYDKRAVNGAPFVYHSTQLVSGEGEVEQEVCNYIFKALDALGVRWGLSHVEVIAETSRETGKIRVRLVEVNCRQHNTNFCPLTNACIGYNALDLVLAAHLGNDDGQGLHWDEIPTLPTTRAYGAIVHFVSHVEGKISQINFDILDEMHDLSSVMEMLVYPQFLKDGNPIHRTIDIRSDTGYAHIINNEEEAFTRDYDRLVQLQKDMFEVE